LAKGKEKGLLKRSLGWAGRFVLKLLLIVVIITIVQVATLRYIDPPFTFSMASIWLKDLFSSDHYIIPKGEWRPLKDISPFIIQAVLAGEDQRFMSHNGFDFVELNQALRDILEDGRVRGASTISMQLARTLFLWQGRSLSRKILEAYYTVLIELFLGKMRILEIYLNMVDWGNGIIGVEAASRKYFNKKSSELNTSQAALLAAILPSPHKWSPLQPNNQVLERRKWIMKNMDKMRL
jgi:monofunctional biosynthetic peptidoglycan transglycosylase